ncbi:hypothetical protein E4U61_004268 [Claviceps capensis]|nr:hypothetical protein E4U61_004268 [Claviceps capensis]
MINGCTQGMQIAVESGAEKVSRNGALVKEIVKYDHDPPTQAFLKELLNDLFDRDLNLTIPDPRFFSPLYRVLRHGKGKPEWAVDLLCENGATVHEDEVNFAFISWCETSRLWETNKYNAWWQHQGQEDKIFEVVVCTVGMTSRNNNGKTPLDILLESGSSKDDVMELKAVLERKVKKVQELA